MKFIRWNAVASVADERWHGIADDGTIASGADRLAIKCEHPVERERTGEVERRGNDGSGASATKPAAKQQGTAMNTMVSVNTETGYTINPVAAFTERPRRAGAWRRQMR